MLDVLHANMALDVYDEIEALSSGANLIERNP